MTRPTRVSEVWTVEPVRELPPSFAANLSDIARADMERWTVYVPHLFKMSRETYCVRHEGRPILVAGAMRMTLLDTTRELWMYGTRDLNPWFLRDLRELFNEWKAEQQGPLYARTDSPVKSRFLRFFGFRFLRVEDGVELFEVKP